MTLTAGQDVNIAAVLSFNTGNGNGPGERLKYLAKHSRRDLTRGNLLPASTSKLTKCPHSRAFSHKIY